MVTFLLIEVLNIISLLAIWKDSNSMVNCWPINWKVHEYLITCEAISIGDMELCGGLKDVLRAL